MGSGHAVVIGASMAGLAAAAELSSHFDRVTILERDEIGDEVAPRRGVPQARHPHALLEVGERAWNGWFPTFTEELIAAGAVRVDMSRALLWIQGGYLARDERPERLLCSMSRPLVEAVARRFVTKKPNVAIRSGASARGLRHADGAIRGVDVEREGATELVDGDLVVDCTGRASPALKWLESFG